MITLLNAMRFKKSKGICKKRFLKLWKILGEEWNTSCFRIIELEVIQVIILVFYFI